MGNTSMAFFIAPNSRTVRKIKLNLALRNTLMSVNTVEVKI
jgi:hypothetical protein